MNTRCTGTFEEFLKGEISISVPSVVSKQYRDLMRKCTKAHLKWASGANPWDYTPNADGEISIFNRKMGLTYSPWNGFKPLPFFDYDELIPDTPDTYEFHISSRDGETTHVVYKKNGKVVERAEARCRPEDTFNFTQGAAIAMSKLKAVQMDTKALNKMYTEALFPMGRGLVHTCKCSDEEV